MGQVAEHDYIEGRKWGAGISNPHVQATEENGLGAFKGEKN